MWTRSLPASSVPSPITIEEAFDYGRKHPVEHVDLERFLGIYTTDARSLIDLRDHGMVGAILDRLSFADGAKPFEWVGAEVDRIEVPVFPVVIERLRRVARDLGIPAVDIPLN